MDEGIMAVEEEGQEEVEVVLEADPEADKAEETYTIEVVTGEEDGRINAIPTLPLRTGLASSLSHKIHPRQILSIPPP